MIDGFTQFLSGQFGVSVLLLAAVLGGILTAVAYAILLERWIAAWCQDRYGPNRVGPMGLLQPLADGAKFILKEEIIPGHVDKALFILAPCIALIVGLLGFAVIPWGGAFRWPWMSQTAAPVNAQVASLDIGLLYIVAVGTLAVYSVVLGGWASNSKYSFYGGMRAAAQMLSYEVPMGLALLVCILTTGHFRLEGMVGQQIATTWTGLLHPVVFLLFFTTALAEANRAPFDLAECEQELVGGYHTEYSGMKLALFFLGEYAHMITSSAFMVALFMGGWELFPWSERTGWAWVNWFNHSTDFVAMLLRVGVVCGKLGAIIFVYMWIRWTLPRLRFDQLMRLAWKGLVPLSMCYVVLAGFLLYNGKPGSILAPLGNVLLLLFFGAIGIMSGKPLTARQEHLPAWHGAFRGTAK